jgi:hypothetical protein
MILEIIKVFFFDTNPNTLLLDNEIIFNFWDSNLINPFANTFQIKYDGWIIIDKPFFNKDSVFYPIILILKHLIHNASKKIGNSFARKIFRFKFFYLRSVKKICNSEWFLKWAGGRIKLRHLKAFINGWVFVAIFCVILLWLCVFLFFSLYLYLTYYFVLSLIKNFMNDFINFLNLLEIFLFPFSFIYKKIKSKILLKYYTWKDKNKKSKD